MSVHRMQQLAGIREAIQVDDPDEEDRRYDERRAREVKIAQLITTAFRRIGLDIAEDGVYYDEESGREAEVTLDDSEVDLTRLAKLITTGLATSYKIGVAAREGYGELIVGFSVSPELDHSIPISQSR
jgi:hypothetical protein